MNLSVIWKLQDMMSPVMNRVTASARNAQAVVDRVNAQMSRGFRTAADSVTGLRDKIDTLTKYRDGLRIGIDGREIRQANSELQLLQSRLDRIDRTNARQSGRGAVGGVILGGLKAAALGFGAYQAIGVGQDMLTDGMNMDKADASFRYFTGNANKANKILDELKAYSNKYAMYKRSDLVASASMIATTMGADSVGRITQMVGKLAQGNSENFKGIITRLQQVKGTGYLQGDELMELLNRGVFGLQEEIARFKGITLQQFNKVKEAQGISYNDVESALIRMTSAGGKYDKILDVIAKSSYGKWNTIKNTVQSKATDIGKSTVGALNGSLDWVIQFLQRSAPIGAAFERLAVAFKPLLNGVFKLGVAFGIFQDKGDGVGSTIETIRSIVDRLAWVVNVAGRAVQWVGGMFEKYPWLKYALGFLAINHYVSKINFAEKGTQLMDFASKFISFPFGAIASGFSTISRAMGFLWANPIGLVVLGVMALGAAIYYAWQKSETFRKVTIQTWEGLKFLWNGAVQLVMEAWSKISPVFIAIGDMWTRVMNLIRFYAVFAWSYIVQIFQTITAPIVNAFEKAKPYLSKFWDWLKDKALGTVRVIAAVTTFGLSEVGLGLFKKFKIGFDKGAGVADKFEKGRAATAKGKGGKSGGFLSDFFGGNIPGLAGMAGKAGSGGSGGKTPGVTDTVNGAVSKQVTININSKIADIYNTFNGGDGEEGISKKITDLILLELNRILSTGDRLAIE